MPEVIREAELLGLIEGACHGSQGFAELREFVFAFFYAQDDREASEPVLPILQVLRTYLEYEEAQGDDWRSERMLRLHRALSTQRWTPENTIAALEYCELEGLIRRLDEGKVFADVVRDRVESLYPQDVNLLAVIDAFKRMRDEETKREDR